MIEKLTEKGKKSLTNRMTPDREVTYLFWSLSALINFYWPARDLCVPRNQLTKLKRETVRARGAHEAENTSMWPWTGAGRGPAD